MLYNFKLQAILAIGSTTSPAFTHKRTVMSTFPGFYTDSYASTTYGSPNLKEHSISQSQSQLSSAKFLTFLLQFCIFLTSCWIFWGVPIKIQVQPLLYGKAGFKMFSILAKYHEDYWLCCYEKMSQFTGNWFLFLLPASSLLTILLTFCWCHLAICLMTAVDIWHGFSIEVCGKVLCSSWDYLQLLCSRFFISFLCMYNRHWNFLEWEYFYLTLETEHNLKKKINFTMADTLRIHPIIVSSVAKHLILQILPGSFTWCLLIFLVIILFFFHCSVFLYFTDPKSVSVDSSGCSVSHMVRMNLSGSSSWQPSSLCQASPVVSTIFFSIPICSVRCFLSNLCSYMGNTPGLTTCLIN